MVPWASGVCSGVHAAGSRDVVYVPDNPLSHVLRDFEARFRDVRLILAMREEEAFGIAAGLYLGGRKPTVMLQSSGLGNSLNAITSLLLPYRIPVLIVVSMRGDEGEWNRAQEPMGRGPIDLRRDCRSARDRRIRRCGCRRHPDGRREGLRTARSPLMIVVKVAESAPTAKPPLDYIAIKQRFMAAIGNAGC